MALDEPYEGDKVVGEMVIKAFDDVAILASKGTVGTFSTKRVRLSEVKYLQQLTLETGCILESVKCPQQIQTWELCTVKDLLNCYLFTN